MSTFDKLDQNLHSLTEDQLRHWLYVVKADKGWSDHRYDLIKQAILKGRSNDGKMSQYKLHSLLDSLRHDHKDEINQYVQDDIQEAYSNYLGV